MDRATLEWIGTMVAEYVVQQLRMTHMQQSGIMNAHMTVCNRVLAGTLHGGAGAASSSSKRRSRGSKAQEAAEGRVV